MSKNLSISTAEPAPFALPVGAAEPLHALLDTWRTIAVQRDPIVDDFDVDALLDTFAGLALIDRTLDPLGRTDFFYRRIGADHEKQVGRPLEGLTFRDVMGTRTQARLIEAYCRIFDAGEPNFWQMANAVAGAPPVYYQRLVVPLFEATESGLQPAGGHGRVASVLGVWVWDPVGRKC
ncbi:MAG: hypothetical protein AAF638_08275 [Pseudomonadota bacterium]